MAQGVSKDKREKKPKGKLGRLSNLGVAQPWHIPLILPVDYRDYRHPVSSITQMHLDGIPRLYHLRKVRGFSEPRWVNGGKVPMRTLRFEDANGLMVIASMFGDTRDLDAIVEAGEFFYVWGVLSAGNQGRSLFLNDLHFVSQDRVGRIEPIYPGVPRVIRPETVAVRVNEAIESGLVDQTVIHLRNLLMIRSKQEQDELFMRLGFGAISLKGVILSAHRPSNIRQGWMAQRILRRLATYFALQVSKSSIERPINPKAALPVTIDLVSKVVSHLPYSLTDEQRHAIEGTVKSLAEPRKSLIAYSADVGAGKTTLFGSVAVACALAGCKVAVLAPNTVLCEQLHKELSETWPFIRYSKVWGASASIDPEGQVFIGTTALINRARENGMRFDLVVVDEEHRFSIEQKEALTQDSTNYIASTATPIPRTLQLATMGAFEVFRITKTHVEKDIRTHIFTSGQEDKVDLYVAKTLEKGYQVFIVLPIAEGSEKPKITAEEAYEIWSAKYPGRVGLVHGKMKDVEKAAVLQKMRDGEIDILCATTVIEVGITIPRARTMIIYHPEVLGLATLHQLRGRLARKGGIGHFVLYLPQYVSEKTFQRLALLKKEKDGFSLAEHDLRMRGFGDLAPNAEKQTGGMPSLLPGYEITVEDVEELMEVLENNETARTKGENGDHAFKRDKQRQTHSAPASHVHGQGSLGNGSGLLHV